MFLCRNIKISNIKLLQNNTYLLIVEEFTLTFCNLIEVKVHVKKNCEAVWNGKAAHQLELMFFTITLYIPLFQVL